jgi:succinyl-diaminopimelate desuccinylase
VEPTHASTGDDAAVTTPAMQPDPLRQEPARPAVLDAAVARSDAWLDAHRDELLDFCGELLRTPSDNPPGECAPIADLAATTCDRIGLSTTRLAVPRPNAPDSQIVLGWCGHETTEPALVANAHLDVIPPGSGWTVDPYRGVVIDGRIYGRGAAASKADVAAYVFALAAARSALGPSSPASAVVALTSDEETGGSYGPRWLLDEYGLKPRLAICPGSTHRVATAHNGCIQAAVALTATPQHAATANPSTDAWPAALRIMRRLEELRVALSNRRSEVPGIDTANLIVTGIHGGGSPGVTMGSVTITIDRRVLPEEDMDAALVELRDAVLTPAGQAVQVEFEPTLVAATMKPTSSQRILSETVRAEASRVLETPVATSGVPIFTDARWFAGAGIPTVMFGVGYADPAEGNGHGPDENAGVAEIEATARIMARVVLRILNLESPTPTTGVSA